MVAVVSMSKCEFDRLETLLGMQSGRLRVAGLLQSSSRYCGRLGS